MMIAAIAVSTMILVALVVFATQYYSYRKNHPKQDLSHSRKKVVGGTQQAPIAS